MSKTNVEMITELMQFSKNGGLQQAFILQAMAYYAQQVKKLSEDEWESPMLSFEAWQSCADEVLEALEQHHNNK